jgi:hypothetical protein
VTDRTQAAKQKRELIFDLFVNGLLPWAGYVFLQSQYGLSDYHALLAVTIIPGFFALVGIIRKGRPDLIATVSLVTILLSLGLAAASDDTRVLQIRESYITLIMGVVFVVSSMMKKPILWLLARHQAKSEEHKAALEHPDRKKMLGTVNAVWGWSFVLEFGAKLWMIENLPISRVLALSPIMFYGVTAVTFLWTLWWLRRETRKAAEAENARRVSEIAKGESPQ